MTSLQMFQGWCLRLEDLRHVWITTEEWPLIRMELGENLTALQCKHLSYAGPNTPIPVGFERGSWLGSSFSGEIIEIDCSQIPHTVKAKKRRPRTMAV